MAAGGIVLVMVGLAKLIFQDFSWELTEISNDLKGVESKRGPVWELGNAASGIVALAIGIALLVGAGIQAAEARKTVAHRSVPPFPGAVQVTGDALRGSYLVPLGRSDSETRRQISAHCEDRIALHCSGDFYSVIRCDGAAGSLSVKLSAAPDGMVLVEWAADEDA